MSFAFPETWYRARCLRVVDGDTVDLRLDLGFRQYRDDRFRLLGVDTPELSAKDPSDRARAVIARERLGLWLGEVGDWPLLVRTEKADSFGRWLADIKVSEGWLPGGAANVNAELIRLELAAAYKR